MSLDNWAKLINQAYLWFDNAKYCNNEMLTTGFLFIRLKRQFWLTSKIVLILFFHQQT